MTGSCGGRRFRGAWTGEPTAVLPDAPRPRRQSPPADHAPSERP
jgi:hypothetical protein